jgi:hypothetical protein
MGNLPLNIFTFPLWWYTTGTSILYQWAKRQLLIGLHQTGILLFAHHMREPLYGDYTRSGRIFSFFFRIIILLYKLVWFLVRSVIVFAIVVGYLLLLPFALVMIIYQLFPL